MAENMENSDHPRVSPRMAKERVSEKLAKIAHIINKMA
mgnify:CR=1 FL=1